MKTITKANLQEVVAGIKGNNRDYDCTQRSHVELATHCIGGSDSDDTVQPLSERWSPLGANYDEDITPTSGLPSPVSELELLGSDSISKHKELHKEDLFQQKYIEEEQELLTSSLMALTSHFAHVQLRVRQIVEAPTHERDQLLKDLDDFAFRGIPESNDTITRRRQFELIEPLKSKVSDAENFVYDSCIPILPQHVLLEKQKTIIDEFKNKLNLKVDERNPPELRSEDFKNQLDSALGELVGPLKMKEQLLAQLKTQISDLERFIAFLQCDSDGSKITVNSNETPSEVYNSYSAKKKTSLATFKKSTADYTPIHSLKRERGYQRCNNSLNSKALGLMDKASILVQMVTTTHNHTANATFQKNTLKQTSRGNHWGDLRAQLEVDIQEIASLAATLCFDKKKLANIKKSLKKDSVNSNEPNSDYSDWERLQPHRFHYNESNRYVLFSDSDDEYNCFHWDKNRRRVAHNIKRGDDSIGAISKELNSTVRKNFCVTLQLLMQHGLRSEIESATSTLIVPFIRCFNMSPIVGSSAERNYRAKHKQSFMTSSTTYDTDIDDGVSSGFFGSGNSQHMHAWELILEYYRLNHGDEYNNTPARKLSQSFNLNMSSNRVSAKQSLLSAIGMIIAMHEPYKRSFNTYFKAFVCASLNSHQLVEWLNLIFSCNDLIDCYYESTSYVACTGFRDSLRSIDSLTKYDFDLPVDLAVRHFKNI